MRLSPLPLFLLFAAAQATAQTNVSASNESTTPKPLWEAGLFGFGVSQTAYPGADERVGRGFVLPYVIYRGKFLRVDDNTVGVRALKTPTTELDIGFSGSFGASSTDVKVREGMPSLGTLFEFGPRLKVNLSERVQLKLPLRAVFDVSNQFRGRGAAFEPELSVGWRLTPATRLSTQMSLIVGDRRLNHHLYGVDPQFATADRPSYEGKAGLIATRLALSTATTLNRDWSLFTFARVDVVEGAANEASPLVRRSAGPSVGVGLAWTFWRSERREE